MQLFSDTILALLSICNRRSPGSGLTSKTCILTVRRLSHYPISNIQYVVFIMIVFQGLAKKQRKDNEYFLFYA